VVTVELLVERAAALMALTEIGSDAHLVIESVPDR
jgi:hypothetical protein